MISALIVETSQYHSGRARAAPGRRGPGCALLLLCLALGGGCDKGTSPTDCVPACQGGSTCVDGKCQRACSAESCPGCCTLEGQCLQGAQQSASACGRGGGLCLPCLPGSSCQDGGCRTGSCGPANCSGCCTATGQCLPLERQDAFSCGRGGGPCGQCPGGPCVHGACQGSTLCDPTTCAGCCLPAGQCLVFSQQSQPACGQRGEPCQACEAAQACVKGACQESCSPSCEGRCIGEPDGCGDLCKSTTCAGCCQQASTGLTCLAGTLPTACGAGGGFCTNCTALGKTCVNQGCGASCTPSCTGRCAGEADGCGGTCRTSTCLGCCYQDPILGVLCMTGDDPFACGSKGAACVDCGPLQTCPSGMCI